MPRSHLREHAAPSLGPERRNGTALVLVLVVIAMMTLTSYTFSELMVTEYRASKAYGQQIQATAFAQSGVEYAAAILSAEGAGRTSALYNNQGLMHVQLSNNGGFTIVSPVQEQLGPTIRTGMSDESGRLNINAIAKLDPEDGVARNMLLALPGMTNEIADSILDWIDSDDEAREYGMESADHTSVAPRNGPIDSFEELLLIPGVTSQLLYGEDTNRNGLLDANEKNGSASYPADNEDEFLDLGWCEYLTLRSKETNLQRSLGMFEEPRLNVNQKLLTELFDAVEELTDTETAMYITAFRLNGPASEGGGTSSSGSGSSGSGSSGGASSSGGSSDDSSSGGSDSDTGESSGAIASSISPNRQQRGLWRPVLNNDASTATTGNLATDTALRDAASSVASALSGGDGKVTRAGLDLSKGATRDIQSLFELVGSEVNIEINGQPSVLTSPWSGDAGNMQQNLGSLFEQFSITDDPEILGRINVLEAPQSLIDAIPDMPEGVAEQIVLLRSQQVLAGGGDDRFLNPGWMVIEGLVDLKTMALLDSSVTARGEVFRMQIVGHAGMQGPTTRLEAVIDASKYAPQVLEVRNLNKLGLGFRKGDLPQFQSDTSIITR